VVEHCLLVSVVEQCLLVSIEWSTVCWPLWWSRGELCLPLPTTFLTHQHLCISRKYRRGCLGRVWGGGGGKETIEARGWIRSCPLFQCVFNCFSTNISTDAYAPQERQVRVRECLRGKHKWSKTLAPYSKKPYKRGGIPIIETIETSVRVGECLQGKHKWSKTLTPNQPKRSNFKGRNTVSRHVHLESATQSEATLYHFKWDLHDCKWKWELDDCKWKWGLDDCKCQFENSTTAHAKLSNTPSLDVGALFLMGTVALYSATVPIKKSEATLYHLTWVTTVPLTASDTVTVPLTGSDTVLFHVTHVKWYSEQHSMKQTLYHLMWVTTRVLLDVTHVEWYSEQHLMKQILYHLTWDTTVPLQAPNAASLYHQDTIAWPIANWP